MLDGYCVSMLKKRTLYLRERKRKKKKLESYFKDVKNMCVCITKKEKENNGRQKKCNKKNLKSNIQKTRHVNAEKALLNDAPIPISLLLFYFCKPHRDAPLFLCDLIPMMCVFFLPFLKEKSCSLSRPLFNVAQFS